MQARRNSGNILFPLITSFLCYVQMTLLMANPLGGQIPQVPAFLPMMTDVPMADKQPIDGEWMISTLKKRIHIEGGRAYVIDPWVHLFVLKVEPMMVVLTDLKRTAAGRYTGQDLPLMGPLSAVLNPSGVLNVSVQGVIGPVKYDLIPISLDDQVAFEREKTGKESSPSPGAVDQSRLENCQDLKFDKNLGHVICNDPIPEPASDQDLANCENLKFDQSLGKVVCEDSSPEQGLANCENLKFDQSLGKVVCIDPDPEPDLADCENMMFDQEQKKIVCLD